MQTEIEPDIFSNNKWFLLKEIAEKPLSPSELAEKTHTSLSNVVQQLKLLEAHGIIKKEKAEPTNMNGKPKMIYSLNKELAYVVFLAEGKAERNVFKLDRTTKGFFNILFQTSNEDVFFLTKFIFQNEDILKKCKAIALIKTTRDSIDLFLITESVDEIRAKFSNNFIQDLTGKTKKIINWTHTVHEVKDGLHRKDKYFIDMVKNSQILSDPENILKHVKDSGGY